MHWTTSLTIHDYAHKFHWYEYFSEYNSHFPILIIFKIDDDGSALRVGAKYKSFTDLESALKKFHYKRILRKLGTGSKYKNMEVAESAAGLLIYKELDYSCIHRGENCSSISSGQRPNTR